MNIDCLCPWHGPSPWAAAAVGPGGGGGGGGEAPKDYTKPRQTMQSPDRLCKAPKNTIQSPGILDKDLKVKILDKHSKYLTRVASPY